MPELKHIIVEKAIDQWQPRLTECLRVKGHRFYQLLYCLSLTTETIQIRLKTITLL